MDLSWKAGGACRWSDPEAFFPLSEADAAMAKGVCGVCRVREPCLEYALDAREPEGIWGGTTAGERRAIVRRRRQEAAAVSA